MANYEWMARAGQQESMLSAYFDDNDDNHLQSCKNDDDNDIYNAV